MTTKTILQAIVDGKLDKDLDGIIEACRDRRQDAGKAIKYTLKRGDKIRIVGSNIKPGYLRGMEFIVKKINPTTISADPVDPSKARRYAHGIRVPFEFAQKV